MGERWRVTVDREVCLGSGVCAASAPEHFRLDGGRSRAIREDIEADEIVLDVANTCPAEAITVYGPAGHRLAPDPI
jgi:ferredoxin